MAHIHSYKIVGPVRTVPLSGQGPLRPQPLSKEEFKTGQEYHYEVVFFAADGRELTHPDYECEMCDWTKKGVNLIRLRSTYQGMFEFIDARGEGLESFTKSRTVDIWNRPGL